MTHTVTVEDGSVYVQESVRVGGARVLVPAE